MGESWVVLGLVKEEAAEVVDIGEKLADHLEIVEIILSFPIEEALIGTRKR